MITFYVGMTGLNIRIDEFMTEDEWKNMPAEDFPANVTWESATVADEQAMNRWIAAKNKWLCAAWTPNQSYEDQQDNIIVMREAAAEMDSLEVVASY
jgi:hypothetical protein